MIIEGKMKAVKYHIILSLFVCLGLMMASPQVQARPFTADAPVSLADLVEGLLPAVVNISSTQKVDEGPEMPEFPAFPPGSPFEDFFEEFMDRHGRGAPSLPPTSLGSGFVIDSKKGYIVTNNHVIRDAQEVRVTFHDDTTLPAEIIGRDEKTDLAVLQVKTKKKLTAVSLGDSDSMRVGDWVVAIGNPFGLGGTVTTGIISARARDINAGPYDDFIQTDASINRGNSGGPMFDLDGKVIGINTAIFSPSGGSVGIGFAIPSTLAQPVIKQLIDYGRTRRGWLGVRIQTVTEEIAESLGLDTEQGALVASLTPGGPAEKAGLKPGDIILKFNNKPVREMRQLPRIVAETPIGDSAPVEYWRDGKRKTVQVKVGELEKAEENGMLAEAMPDDSTATPVKSLGFSVKTLNDKLRSSFELDPQVEGVLISDVERGGEAEEKGLAVGDVIVEMNQTKVTSAKQITQLVEKAKKSKRQSILLLVNRGGDVRFVALTLEE